MTWGGEIGIEPRPGLTRLGNTSPLLIIQCRLNIGFRQIRIFGKDLLDRVSILMQALYGRYRNSRA